jgi:hypothetical protein
MGTVANATRRAIRAAIYLTPADVGAVAALRVLAMKIDTEDELRKSDLASAPAEQKPRPVDNVTIPTYLKFCESLGLTPAGRSRLDLPASRAAPVVKKEAVGGNLAKLRSVKTGRSA